MASKRPITTVKGRVVYERKVHEFTDKDLLRVFRHVIEQKPGDSWVAWLVDFFFLMIRIALESVVRFNKEVPTGILASLIGQTVLNFVQLMYEYVEDATDFVIDVLVGLLGVKKDE